MRKSIRHLKTHTTTYYLVSKYISSPDQGHIILSSRSMSSKTRARLYEYCAVWGLELRCVMWVMRSEVWFVRCLWQWSVPWCEGCGGRGEVLGSRSQAVGFRWCARGDRAELKGLWCGAVVWVSRVGCQVWDVWREVWSQKSEVWEGVYNIPYTWWFWSDAQKSQKLW